MYEYRFITARKQQREVIVDDMAAQGFRLHTAQLTATGMWEFVFERSATPVVTTGYWNPDIPAAVILEGELTTTPDPVETVKKKPGRKPKVKMGDV